MDTITSQVSQSQQLDLYTIDISEQYERRAWALSLGITEERLVEIVHVMGPSADRIRAYLRNRSNA